MISEQQETPRGMGFDKMAYNEATSVRGSFEEARLYSGCTPFGIQILAQITAPNF